MAMPASTFQTGSPSEFEGVLHSSGIIKNFISRQVLTTIFDATGILVFLPVLFGYSPFLALIVTVFSMIIGAISLFSVISRKIQIAKFSLSLTFLKIGAKTKIVMVTFLML